MAFTRRADLTCTYDEMMQYGSVVLLKNEIIRIKMNDGTFSTKRGDGVTPISQLPFEIDHELSNILKVKKSGVGMVSFGNISPLNHMISVKVDVDNVADYRDVTVTRRGKNMFNNDTSIIKEITLVTSTGEEHTRFGYALALPVGVYTASLIDLGGYTADGGDRFVYGVVNDKNGAAKSNVDLVVATDFYTRTFTIADGDILYIYDGWMGGLVHAQNVFESVQIQVEPGREATSFAPYVEPVVYFVTQEGRTSIPPVYPVTTLSTDSRLRIEALYNVNIHDLNEEVNAAKNDIQSAKKNIATLQGKVTDLTYAVDVMEGITGLEGTNFVTVKKSTTENSVVLGTWYPEDVWFDCTFADGSIFKIDKIKGGVKEWFDDNGASGFTRCAIKSATFAGKKLFEIPDELIAQLDGYGLADGLEQDNFIMFGERGVYYVQNCYWNSAKYYEGMNEPTECLEPLAKPIITDITDYVNFSGYCEFSNEGTTITTEAEATMTFEVVEYHDLDNQASLNPFGYLALNFEIVGVQ